jgi:hypothetical protein
MDGSNSSAFDRVNGDHRAPAELVDEEKLERLLESLRTSKFVGKIDSEHFHARYMQYMYD